jgi:replication factor C subunit 3/5
MLLIDKYRPKICTDFIFNQEILDKLHFIAAQEEIPHIIFSGPVGGGKKTLAKFFLRAIYDDSVDKTVKSSHVIVGSGSKKIVEIAQSNYHIEVDPTCTNNDKHILQEVIKKYANYHSFDIFQSRRSFKVILIYNIENLAPNSQAALRRTMETYAKTCRFIMICNNLSKIIDPLRSRCSLFCIPSPSPDSIIQMSYHIAIMENIKLSVDDRSFIRNSCNANMEKMIWFLEYKKKGLPLNNTIEYAIESLVDEIFEVKTEKNICMVFYRNIRLSVYDMLTVMVDGSTIISSIMDLVIQRIDDNKINIRIVELASIAENNRAFGRRDIAQIDFFILGVIKEILTIK